MSEEVASPPELRIPPELEEFRYIFHDSPHALRRVLEVCIRLTDASQSGSAAAARATFGLGDG